MLNLLTLWCIPVHNELITPIIQVLDSKRVNNRYKTIRLKLTILSYFFVGKSYSKHGLLSCLSNIIILNKVYRGLIFSERNTRCAKRYKTKCGFRVSRGPKTRFMAFKGSNVTRYVFKDHPLCEELVVTLVGRIKDFKWNFK